MSDLNQLIDLDPAVRGGKPCIRGTRITVYDILEYLAGGMTEADILADFPSLRAEHIRACLAFAGWRERHSGVGPSRTIRALPASPTPLSWRTGRVTT